LKGTLRANFSPASNKLISASISYDTGIVLSQLHQLFDTTKITDPCDEVEAAVAAQVAASEADAILDSLQMPHIEAAVPANVTVVPQSGSSAGSETSSDKGDSSDEDAPESPAGMTTRRVIRRND
jgi:hypothetical protein